MHTNKWLVWDKSWKRIASTLAVNGARGGVQNGTSMCNIADGAGLSGLEVYVKLYSETTVYTFGLLILFELACHLFTLTKRARRTVMALLSLGSAVVPVEKSKSSSSSDTKTRIISEYEKASLMSKRSHSVFSSTWAKPIVTPWRKTYYHISAMIEDNVILWGPILISLTYYPLALALGLFLGKRRAVEFLIGRRFYVAVLTDHGQLTSERQNQRAIPEFVQKYDFEQMSLLFNGDPVH